VPEIRYYRVQQVREVRVQSNTPIDAARIADAKFAEQPKPSEIFGEVVSEIRNVNLLVSEER
jgi:hypothetical protein